MISKQVASAQRRGTVQRQCKSQVSEWRYQADLHDPQDRVVALHREREAEVERVRIKPARLSVAR